MSDRDCTICGNPEQHPIHPTGHWYEPADAREERTPGAAHSQTKEPPMTSEPSDRPTPEPLDRAVLNVARELAWQCMPKGKHKDVLLAAVDALLAVRPADYSEVARESVASVNGGDFIRGAWWAERRLFREMRMPLPREDE